MSGSVVAAAAAGAFTLASIGLTVRLWHDPSRAGRAVGAYMWLPCGEDVKRGLVRATATRILALGAATGICVVAATSADGLKRPGAAVAVVVIALLALVILSLLLAVSILLV